MIDISNKGDVFREAIATGRIKLKQSTISEISHGNIKKGNVIEVSKVSGVQAAKNTSQNIPFCHQILLESVTPELEMAGEYVEVKCTVKARYKTGVEMEALSCVTSMLLTVWDMVKYLEKDENGNYPDTSLTEVRVVEKRKDSSGA